MLVSALTVAALLIHGYHPYAEDGGVYLPEIKRLIDPALYPHTSEFIVGHLHFSLFAPMIAALVRLSGLRVETLLFAVYLASFWVTLLAAWLLAAQCFPAREARCGAVSLLAVWITLPIAGTSLMLMDPYVTARSLSTPCALLALAGALQFLRRAQEAGRNSSKRFRGLALCFIALAAATAMHPLMGAYALGAVLLLVTVLSSNRVTRLWGTAGLTLSAVGVAGLCVVFAPPENEIYQQIALTRSYWFLSRWHWYELSGIFAPLAILAAFSVTRTAEVYPSARVGLARMALIAGSAATTVAFLYAWPSMTTHLVARLQPLRLLQIVYIVMILVLGAALGQYLLRRSAVRWLTTFAALAAVSLYAQRITFPDSSHIEFAGKPTATTLSAQTNPWEQAFTWISRNTPRDAIFALDADYINLPGEDAQGFRAIAERGALPDYSKDGGVVTNEPELSAAWNKAQQSQANLSAASDAQRYASLKPLGVTWMVLQHGARTALPCPFENKAVKVCRLP